MIINYLIVIAEYQLFIRTRSHSLTYIKIRINNYNILQINLKNFCSIFNISLILIIIPINNKVCERINSNSNQIFNSTILKIKLK